MATNHFGSRHMVQVGLVVRDIEAKARIWAGLFGVEPPDVVLTAGVEEAHTRYRGEPTRGRAKLAFIDMGSLTLELIEPVDGPSTWRDFLEEKGEGVHHIALNVKGTDEITADLAGQGIDVVQRGDYTGGRYTYVASDDALGVVVELLENLGK